MCVDVHLGIVRAERLVVWIERCIAMLSGRCADHTSPLVPRCKAPCPTCTMPRNQSKLEGCIGGRRGAA